MTFRVELTSRAQQDLAAIYEYIHAGSSTHAFRWFNGLEDAILEHFSCYCIAYPQWANQAEALLPVTWDKASVMAASRLSTVRALAERSCCLIFDHACSMGLKSGE